MKTSNDGGMAFPTVFPEEHYGTAYRGMTLRDYFAGQALAGIVTGERLDLGSTKRAMADAAYLQADAMLDARERKEDAK
jgi:hypothetical protein